MDVLIVLFLSLLLLFIASLVILLIYSGLLSSFEVAVGKPFLGNSVVAYKYNVGPFSECGAFFSESTSIAPTNQQVGIYFDDPDQVSPPKLRWAVGAVISGPDGSVDNSIWKAYEKEGYKRVTLPAVPASVNCVFPHTTMISILIAIKRVYPAMKSYISERGLRAHPYIEIYDQGKIFFMAPLSDNESFYVPEALVSSPGTEPVYDSCTVPEALGKSPFVEEAIRESSLSEEPINDPSALSGVKTFFPDQVETLSKMGDILPLSCDMGEVLAVTEVLSNTDDILSALSVIGDGPLIRGEHGDVLQALSERDVPHIAVGKCDFSPTLDLQVPHVDNSLTRLSSDATNEAMTHRADLQPGIEPCETPADVVGEQLQNAISEEIEGIGRESEESDDSFECIDATALDN